MAVTIDIQHAVLGLFRLLVYDPEVGPVDFALLQKADQLSVGERQFCGVMVGSVEGEGVIYPFRSEDPNNAESLLLLINSGDLLQFEANADLSRLPDDGVDTEVLSIGDGIPEYHICRRRRHARHTTYEAAAIDSMTMGAMLQIHTLASYNISAVFGVRVSGRLCA